MKLYSLLSSSFLCSIGVLGAAMLPSPTLANPEGGSVAAGAATIHHNGSKTDIRQTTDKAVIDWRKFNIEAGEHTQFHQPSASSLTLNRVNDTNPSRIMGTLSANGNIVVMNPNGVFFGKGSQVDVNGLIATTADIDTDRFMRGELVFDKPGNPQAAIINNGSINAREAGLVGLVAPNVLNNGVINARLGTVHLASGDTVTVDLYGNGLMEVEVSDAVKNQWVHQAGAIHAEDGTIALTAAAGKELVDSLITAPGELHAPSVQQKNGKIIIQAAGSNAVAGNDSAQKGIKKGTSTVLTQGVLNASGYDAGQKGGDITVTADQIAVLDGTVIDASGDAGGGNIKIGGDYLGTGDTPTAKTLYVAQEALTLNNALGQGDGGRTIFWSDDTTAFHGKVYARGGALGGDGGFLETSGKNNLLADGFADLTAPQGNKGTYLLDPNTITILGNFSPLDVGGNVLWLDAADTSTITSTGGLVDEWRDKSGLDNHATATGAQRPTTGTATLNGENVIRFNGSSNYMTVADDDSLDGFAGMTIFTMTTPLYLDNSPDAILSKRVVNNNNQSYSMFFYTNRQLNTDINGSNDRFATANNFTAGNTYLLTLNYDGSLAANQRAKIYQQGLLTDTRSETSTSVMAGTGNLYLGALNANYGNYLNADIPEILIYNKSLTTNQQQLVDQYLSAKWNRALNPTSASNTEAVEAMSATGYSTFTTRYLERLSTMADIVLQATDSITLDLAGDTLTLDNGRNISLTTSTGDITTASAGTIITNRDGGAGGNISFSAGDDILINHALTLQADNGGAITMTAAGGDIASNGNLTLRADSVTLNNTVTGDLAWQSDAAQPTATFTSGGNGTLDFSTITAGRSLMLGNTSGADTNLAAATINSMQNGFSALSFGDATAGDITNATAAWSKNLSAQTGADFINSVDATSSGTLLVEATGDVVLNEDLATTSSAANALVLSAGADFTNNAGADALSASNSRWVVYSLSSLSDTRDGLLPTASEFGKTYAANAPATLAAGNRYVYANSTRPSLTYTVANDAVTYGQNYSGYSLSYTSGLVGDDTLSTIGLTGAASFSTTYSAGTNAGSYTDALTAAVNTLATPLGYQFSFNDGDLTVNKASLTTTLANSSPSRNTNQANPAFTLSYSGFVLGQNSSVLATPPTASTTATASSTAGNYPITLSGGSDTNYTFSYSNPVGQLQVIAPNTQTTTAPLPPTVGQISQDPRLMQSTTTSTGTAATSNQNLPVHAPTTNTAGISAFGGMVEITPEVAEQFSLGWLDFF